jgi:hypothetical protein
MDIEEKNCMLIPDSALDEIMFAATRGNPVLQNDMVYRECIARALAAAANQAHMLNLMPTNVTPTAYDSYREGVFNTVAYLEEVSNKLATTVPQG